MIKKNLQNLSHTGLPENTNLCSHVVFSGIWALVIYLACFPRIRAVTHIFSVRVSTFASTAIKFSRTIYLCDLLQLVNKTANVVSHDIVYRLHQSIPYFWNWVWICSICINLMSFMHVRKVSHPCTSFPGTHKSSAALFAEFLYPVSPISDKKYC